MEEIQKINKIFESYKIKANCIGYKKNKNYVLYDVKLNAGCKLKDLEKYSNEISLCLKSVNKPNIYPVFSEGIVRLEFAEAKKNKLDLFNLLKNSNKPNDMNLPIVLGEDCHDNPLWFDLSSAPHLLISGTTGSGKTTIVHNIIANLFISGKTHLFLIDPKKIEFFNYEKYKNYSINIGYTYEYALSIIDYLYRLMEERYNLIRAGKDIASMSYCTLIIDEFADLIFRDENKLFHNKLCALAQKSRAAKIHIILSTQRPSTDVISGLIKANFPSRIACKVSSHIDSKVILDMVGAENLSGKGDAFLKDSFGNLLRFQAAYSSPELICNKFSA